MKPNFPGKFCSTKSLSFSSCSNNGNLATELIATCDNPAHFSIHMQQGQQSHTGTQKIFTVTIQAFERNRKLSFTGKSHANTAQLVLFEQNALRVCQLASVEYSSSHNTESNYRIFACDL